MILRIILLFIIILPLQNALAQSKEHQYSFFTAGHTYGNPNSPQLGLLPSFLDYLPQLNADSKMELAFLTGDFVESPTEENYNAAQTDLDKFSMPYYIAAGNHDISPEFESRFNEYYFSFTHHQDLFIILTPGLNKWNIEGEQLAFLEKTLEDDAAESRHIFIILHELIWWSPDNIFQDVDINWEPHYPGFTNYEETIKPLLLSYPNKIFLYAGDVGATQQVSPCMYYQNKNLTLVASGMGSGNQDNIIVSKIYNDSVYLDLVALNDENPNVMGELSDWRINDDFVKTEKEKPKIYPNPAQDYIVVETDYDYETLTIINSSGKLIKQYAKKFEKIDISDIANGIYILEITSENLKHHKKLIINK